MGRKLKQWLLILALPLLLSGCMMAASAEDLYALPQLPEEYKALNARLSEILAGGAEYAPPQAGGNLPQVQMLDLDGDGSDEALAFFRVSSEDRPLKIYVFRAVGDDYQQVAVIEGSGTAIHSIRYEDMNGDGVQELLVSWRVSTEVQTLTVYAMRDLDPLRLLNTPYARYELVDLDGDEDQELVVLRSDDTEAGQTLAEYYDWDSAYSSLQLHSTARLSSTVASIQGVQAGQLMEGEKALFVTSRSQGADDTSRAITDIVAFRGGELTNIVLSSDTGVSTETFRYLNIQPMDVNGDEATDVPRPAELFSQDVEDSYWKIYWHSYNLDGVSEQQAVTYHNLTDGWYLQIPDGWDNHFTVRQNNTSSSVHSTTFYSVHGWTMGQELMTIYTFTGTNRENEAAKSGRSILRRLRESVYAISYSDFYSEWMYAVDNSVITERFKHIPKRWSMSE